MGLPGWGVLACETSGLAGRTRTVPKPFPPDYRRDVVAVLRKGEASKSLVARDFGISKSCLQRWLTTADRVRTHLRTASIATATYACGHQAEACYAISSGPSEVARALSSDTRAFGGTWAQTSAKHSCAINRHELLNVLAGTSTAYPRRPSVASAGHR